MFSNIHASWFFFVNYDLRFVSLWSPTPVALWLLPNDISIISLLGINFQILPTLLIRPHRIPLMLFPLPPPFLIIAPRVPFCENDIPWHLQSFSFLFSATTLLWNLPLHVTLMSLPVCFFLSAEWYLVWALLLRCIQGNEPHAVHRLWPSGPRESIRYLAHHAEHDCRSYLLCCFYWSRDGAYPVPGLFKTAISGKGEELY